MYKYNKTRSFKDKPLMFFISVILIAAFGLGIIIILVWHLKNKAEKLKITDTKIEFEQGLLNKNRTELNISSVRTVKIKQDFSQRIFGVGDIEIYTAGDNPEFVAYGMPNPNSINEIIQNNGK